MARVLYDLCKKDGTVMVYSITGLEVVETIGCKLLDVYNSACYGHLIKHTLRIRIFECPHRLSDKLL